MWTVKIDDTFVIFVFFLAPNIYKKICALKKKIKRRETLKIANHKIKHTIHETKYIRKNQDTIERKKNTL